ncbi:MAG: hypothetical protein ACI4B3_06460 [Prevotella sp.]
MQKRIFYRIFTALTICLAACDNIHVGKTAVEKVAEEFALAYFNYDFGKASELITGDSRKWIEFEATNIGYDDITLLREKESGATVDIVNVEEWDENNASVSVRVCDFLDTDTIGGKGHIVSEDTFVLKMQRTEDGQWKVRMEGPLRSGK